MSGAETLNARPEGRKPRLVAVVDQLTGEEFLSLPGAECFDVRLTGEVDRTWLECELPAADAFWASLRVPLDEALLAASPHLRTVSTNTTGTDHLCAGLLAQRGIELLSLKEDLEFLRQVTATAELAFGLLLSCARRLPEGFAAARNGDWGRHAYGGAMLSGKTLGILGCGRLGTMMCGYGQAFRMRVIACDPHRQELPSGVERVDLRGLLVASDFLSLHVHLSDATRRMLGPDEFAAMKPGITLINTSRGALIDESALIRAMENGRVAAAGLDVIDGEWMDNLASHPILAYSRKNPRLLVTPHVGGACRDATLLSARHAMAKLAARFGAH
ncbi:MAG TPA: NAD(P)-dependent oxidoreductase [Terrimicrobiaceae bacterium]|nr:NAD(P)-dependent oxidoreductase [Terrimicrobiaceae bacterium]